jgi:hypothetical protein
MVPTLQRIRRAAGFTLIVAFCLAGASSARASGTYCSCLPKPPRGAKAGDIDRDKFDLGQKVFNGKAAPAQGDATAQRSRLEALNTQLPASVARKKNLPVLAGQLSTEQLDALDYFVKQRYPAK